VIIRVDRGGPSLLEPEDCTRFHVDVVDPVGGDEVLGLLGTWSAGGDGSHVWIRIEALRVAVAGRVGPTWESDFAGMVSYAASKGWLDESGSAIRAHLA